MSYVLFQDNAQICSSLHKFKIDRFRNELFRSYFTVLVAPSIVAFRDYVYRKLWPVSLPFCDALCGSS